MATLADVMTALADQIRTAIAGVTDIDVQVEGRSVRSPSVPCIDMYPADPSDDQTLAAFGDVYGGEYVTVRARVSTADADAGEDLLLAFMDDEDDLSIAAAVDADPTLSGHTAAADVINRSGYRDFPIPGSDDKSAYLGCLWTVRLVKARS